MNVEQDSQVCRLFEMTSAREDGDSGVTCHGYGSKTQVIDHIFYEGLMKWTFQTVRGPWAGFTYISDHNPVMAQFRYYY